MSVWHRPDVSILTRTSPRPGLGIGTSSMLRGLAKSWTTAAFMRTLHSDSGLLWPRLLRSVSAERARSDLSHLHAAVDGDDTAGDIAGVVLEQEPDRMGDLLGAPQSARGDVGLDPVERLFGNRGHHFGVDEAGSDAVHRDPAPGRLERQTFREAEQARLRCRVVGLANAAGLTDDGTDVDDATEAATNHVLEDRFGHVEGTREVDP